MSELKPCPFCGRQPVIKQTGETQYWWVGCEIHLSIESHGCGVSHSSYNKDDAISKWNTRHDELENQQLKDMCRELTEALRLLHDYQNGCPLDKYELGWNKAMRLTQHILPLAEKFLIEDR